MDVPSVVVLGRELSIPSGCRTHAPLTQNGHGMTRFTYGMASTVVAPSRAPSPGYQSSRSVSMKSTAWVRSPALIQTVSLSNSGRGSPLLLTSASLLLLSSSTVSHSLFRRAGQTVSGTTTSMPWFGVMSTGIHCPFNSNERSCVACDGSSGTVRDCSKIDGLGWHSWKLPSGRISHTLRRLRPLYHSSIPVFQ